MKNIMLYVKVHIAIACRISVYDIILSSFLVVVLFASWNIVDATWRTLWLFCGHFNFLNRIQHTKRKLPWSAELTTSIIHFYKNLQFSARKTQLADLSSFEHVFLWHVQIRIFHIQECFSSIFFYL